MSDDHVRPDCHARSGKKPTQDFRNVPCKFDVRADSAGERGEVRIEFVSVGYAPEGHYPVAVWMSRQKAAELVARLSNVLADRGERVASYSLSKPDGTFIIDEFKTGKATYFEVSLTFENAPTSLAVVNTADEALAVVNYELKKDNDGPAPALSGWTKK